MTMVTMMLASTPLTRVRYLNTMVALAARGHVGYPTNYGYEPCPAPRRHLIYDVRNLTHPCKERRIRNQE